MWVHWHTTDIFLENKVNFAELCKWPQFIFNVYTYFSLIYLFCLILCKLRQKHRELEKILRNLASATSCVWVVSSFSSAHYFPLSIHFSTAGPPPLYIDYLPKTNAARMILRMIQRLLESLKAELISRPSYTGVPAGRHKAISGLWCPPTVPAALSLPHPLLLSGIYFPLSLPPTPHSKVTPSEILHLLSLSLSLSAVSSSHDGWAPHSGVSQPVHHGPRLGIKNCKRFTIANPPFFSGSPTVHCHEHASNPAAPAAPSPKKTKQKKKQKQPRCNHQRHSSTQPNALSQMQLHLHSSK